MALGGGKASGFSELADSGRDRCRNERGRETPAEMVAAAAEVEAGRQRRGYRERGMIPHDSSPFAGHRVFEGFDSEHES